MYKTLLFILFLSTLSLFPQQKKLEFFQTDWGRELSWDAFCEKTKASGYDGLETWFPSDAKSQAELKAALDKYDLKVGFLNGTNKSLPFAESLAAYTEHFKTLMAWKPAYINCHTGNGIDK